MDGCEFPLIRVTVALTPTHSRAMPNPTHPMTVMAWTTGNARGCPTTASHSAVRKTWKLPTSSSLFPKVSGGILTDSAVFH
jgi:hypothetical protein